MSPKPACEQLLDLVKGRWWTHVETKTGPAGETDVQGFFGEYEIEARTNGGRLTGRFSLASGRKEPIRVQLA